MVMVMASSPPDASDTPGIRTEFDASTGVGTILLARPRSANALRPVDLYDLRDAVRAFERMNVPVGGAGRERPAGAGEVKCVVLSSEGERHFCAGLDLAEAASVFGIGTRSRQPSREGHAAECEGTEREELFNRIRELQDCVTCISRASFPVIAVVSGACYGLGVDIISAADIIICDESARFCVKEVDMAITADLGSLQRLPPIIGLNNARELAMTCRMFDGSEAQRMGLVSSVSPSAAALRDRARRLSESIAAKPTLALRGTKRILNGAYGSHVGSLDMNAMNNAAIMVSEQLRAKLRARL